MDRIAIVLAAAVGLGIACAARGDDGVALREEGTTPTRALIEMKAKGERFLAEPKPADPRAKAEPPKASPFQTESRLDFHERVAESGPDGAPTRTARRVVEAAVAVGDGRGVLSLRPEVALLVARRRDLDLTVVSLGGPLTRWELDLVQAAGDTLALPGLLPTKPVKVGDRWPASAEAARNLCDYDALTSNGLEARLEAIDDAEAKVKLGGEVRGSARGGDGVVRFSGRMIFDRKAKRVRLLELNRDEARSPGLAEWGLKVKSTLTVERGDSPEPSGLGDDVMATLPKEDDPARESLLLAPGARYTLEHDRSWHLTREDPRRVELRKIDKGALVAQCNLSVGPNAGKGRHQDVDAFRADVKARSGLGSSGSSGAGEVEADPQAGYQYKMTAAGRQGALAVLWHYYPSAGPEGDQLLATFTLEAGAEALFADGDRAILGSLRWRAAPAAK